MELRPVEGMRVCAECGHGLADWKIEFYWAGITIHLCDEHYDTLGCLMPKPTKPKKETKPRKVIY